jgi:hypothetical protein
MYVFKEFQREKAPHTHTRGKKKAREYNWNIVFRYKGSVSEGLVF